MIINKTTKPIKTLDEIILAQSEKLKKLQAKKKLQEQKAEKLLIAKFLKYKNLVNDDALLFGALEHFINTLGEQTPERLEYFRALAKV